MAVYVLAHTRSSTNLALLHALRASGRRAALVRPAGAGRLLPTDVAIGRLDVRPTMDGIEDGLDALEALERRGVHLLNPAGALRAAHDKAETARCLAAREVPHPRTWELGAGDDLPDAAFPVVVKPRFGSWGRGVVRCDDAGALALHLATIADEPWFAAAGAVVQEAIEGPARDLRLIVAAHDVVGAIARVASPGEWRTNVSLGAARRRAEPDSEASATAIWAAAALGLDLAGVDLMRGSDGRWWVLEVNGAVDLSRTYGLPGRDPFTDAVDALLPTAAAAAPALA